MFVKFLKPLSASSVQRRLRLLGLERWRPEGGVESLLLIGEGRKQGAIGFLSDCMLQSPSQYYAFYSAVVKRIVLSVIYC